MTKHRIYTTSFSGVYLLYIAKVAEENKSARVVERDGESLPVTMDFMPGRLNLSVRDGKVYHVQVEGEER